MRGDRGDHHLTQLGVEDAMIKPDTVPGLPREVAASDHIKHEAAITTLPHPAAALPDMIHPRRVHGANVTSHARASTLRL